MLKYKIYTCIFTFYSTSSILSLFRYLVQQRQCFNNHAFLLYSSQVIWQSLCPVPSISKIFSLKEYDLQYLDHLQKLSI